MRNTIADLNNYLFEQLERLQDDDLSDDQLKKETVRAGAVTMVANSIINAGKISLQAAKLQVEYGDSVDIPGVVGCSRVGISEKKRGGKNGR